MVSAAKPWLRSAISLQISCQKSIACHLPVWHHGHVHRLQNDDWQHQGWQSWFAGFAWQIHSHQSVEIYGEKKPNILIVMADEPASASLASRVTQRFQHRTVDFAAQNARSWRIRREAHKVHEGSYWQKRLNPIPVLANAGSNFQAVNQQISERCAVKF